MNVDNLGDFRYYIRSKVEEEMENKISESELFQRQIADMQAEINLLRQKLTNAHKRLSIYEHKYGKLQS